jgi:hypothetical protein
MAPCSGFSVPQKQQRQEGLKAGGDAGPAAARGGTLASDPQYTLAAAVHVLHRALFAAENTVTSSGPKDATPGDHTMPNGSGQRCSTCREAGRWLALARIASKFSLRSRPAQ